MNENLSIVEKTTNSLDKRLLVIRYSALFTDQSDNPKDKERMAQLVFSLMTLRDFVLPYVNYQIVIYTTEDFKDRLQEIFYLLEIAKFELILLDNQNDIDFSESINRCSLVDRICIRRMLADFRELPTNSFRLLLGNDIYFLSIPHEIISYTWNFDPETKVLYMIDDFFFRTKPYRLTYYRGNILEGLLGDFYCLAPGIELSRDSIKSALKIIDGWPPYRRWEPELPRNMTKVVHACEQQAAAMLLGNFPAKCLPKSFFNNCVASKKCVVLHSGQPWRNIALGEIPRKIAEQAMSLWSNLGLIDCVNLARSEVRLPFYQSAKNSLWVKFRR